METLIVDLKNIGKAAEMLLHMISKKTSNTTTATVVHLIGEMGAGKTTFTKSVAQLLGVQHVVHSPTFIMMNEYDVLASLYSDRHKKMIHIDAYRFEKKDESKVLEIENYMKDGNLILIEWPTLMHAPLPDVTVTIDQTDDENIRKIHIKNHTDNNIKKHASKK